MITRRVLIGSGIVAGSVYGFGIHAKEIPITESPFFAVHDDSAYVLSMRRVASNFVQEDHNRPHITRERFADCTPVESIIAAEDRLLADARDMHLDAIAQMVEPTKVQYQLDQLLKQRRDLSALPFNIIRASNRIAKVSRRGMGNHVLMHPEMFARLQCIKHAPCGLVAPRKIGRWTKVGMYINSIHLFIGEALPPNQIVAFYRNVEPIESVIDGPIVVISDGSNLAMTTYPDKIFRFAIPSQAFL